ncbi:hypothetical protein AX17_003548 [Amanita inopinata Kibby_2008]|nr:hypothetical protein AX17_003548 [Amanita inopinata Kibby_2008]
MNSMNLRPIIAICGTTGVGKSNLAIELALHLSRGFLSWKGARIINADSMQVYRGMDIITNKVPESERQGVEHLLMGFKEPGEQYVVGQWIQDALKVIAETHARSEIPIVVGGTSYWLQHLIFPGRLVSEGKSLTTSVASPPASSNEHEQVQYSDALSHAISILKPDLYTLFTNLPDQPPSASTDPDVAFLLFSLLSDLDPAIASRWHWRDTRKVLRSLQIIRDTGRMASEILVEQSNDAMQGKPRFRTLCLWLYSEPAALAERLDSRVDNMIQQGLLDEVRDLRKIAASHKGSIPDIDYTLGIYQSIGYREFHEYLTSQASNTAFQNAVDRMKTSTRQYAKRQVSWIKNKLLPAVKLANRQMPNSVPTFLLDATRKMLRYLHPTVIRPHEQGWASIGTRMSDFQQYE